MKQNKKLSRDKTSRGRPDVERTFAYNFAYNFVVGSKGRRDHQHAESECDSEVHHLFVFENVSFICVELPAGCVEDFALISQA